MVQTAYACPSCRAPLAPRQGRAGRCWPCTGCGGVAVTLAVLRQCASGELTNRLWNGARAAETRSERACPACARALTLFALEEAGVSLELDACVADQLFWFDHAELTRLGVVWPEAPRPTPPSAEARRALIALSKETHEETRRQRKLVEVLLELLDDWP